MVTVGDEWLAAHSLQTLKLTVEHVLQKAKVTRDSKTTYSRDVLEESEAKLKDLLTLYSDRIQWLQTGSRRWFGHVRGGDNVMLLVDSSERACDIGRVEEYNKALSCLVEEQLSNKSLLYCTHYGTDIHRYPPVDFPTDRENLRVEVMQSSLVQPVPRGHCNLLAALRLGLTSATNGVDMICLVLCGTPDQEHDIIIDHVSQRLAGCTSPVLHLVAFDCDDDEVMLLRRIAEITNSSFHHYSTCQGEQYGIVFDGDLSAVKEAAAKCQAVLFQVHQAKAGLMNAPLIEILKELSVESSWTERSDGCLSLDIAIATDHHYVKLCTSLEWLECNGIEGLGLNLFKLLLPDSIIPSIGHVPIINKSVSSVLNNASIRYAFPDGQTRKLHVDFPTLCYYQNRMDRFIAKMERRINYLTSESRRIFGLLAERNVLIIVDTSTPVASHIIRLQEDLKLLLQQQLPLVDSFNMVSFNSDYEVWRSELVEPSPDTLAEAWMWVAMLKCEGTCNVMCALKYALQLQTQLQYEQSGSHDISLGVYLIMGNEPDQDMVELHSYAEQCLGGAAIRLHVTYYGDSPTPTLANGRYGDKGSVTRCLRYLATAGHGRFHRYTLSGNVIADDVEVIEEEIRRAIEYQRHVDCILELYYNECVNHQPLPLPESAVDEPIKRSPAPPPRHNTASLARMNTISKRLNNSHNKHYKSSPINITTDSFYLDWGLQKGHITQYSSPVKLHSRRDHMIPETAVTMEISSQKWIGKYGMDALRLRLSQYKVAKQNQTNSKKIFHYANKKGEVTRLLLTKKEIRQYISKLRNALEVYRKRMKWLLSGSRQMFGVICEQCIIIMVDSSASMVTHWPELTNQIELLLNDQLIPRGIHFTIISFATSVKCYSGQLVTADRADVIVDWLNNIKPSGCTSMLDAIKLAMTIPGAEAILLVTDGNQDHSREYFMDKLTAHYSTLPIHTVAYHCDDDRECLQLLKQISMVSGGRFHHSSISDMGDDNQLLASEVTSADNDLSVVSSLV